MAVSVGLEAVQCCARTITNLCPWRPPADNNNPCFGPLSGLRSPNHTYFSGLLSTILPISYPLTYLPFLPYTPFHSIAPFPPTLLLLFVPVPPNPLPMLSFLCSLLSFLFFPLHFSVTSLPFILPPFPSLVSTNLPYCLSYPFLLACLCSLNSFCTLYLFPTFHQLSPSPLSPLRSPIHTSPTET